MSPAQRASHCFLLDRGYLKYAKAQNIDVTNLIQILKEENFKYHGTVQLNDKIPFKIVDIIEGSTVSPSNTKPIVQACGQRSRYVSQRGEDQVSAMRHGATKVRVGLIGTNLSEAKQDG